MDLNFLSEMYVPIVMAGCLIVGYILKKWPKDPGNKWIPTILVVLGAALGCLANGQITLQNIVYGAFTGLASTGFHQAFKQLISRTSKNDCKKEGQDE